MRIREFNPSSNSWTCCQHFGDLTNQFRTHDDFKRTTVEPLLHYLIRGTDIDGSRNKYIRVQNNLHLVAWLGGTATTTDNLSLVDC